MLDQNISKSQLLAEVTQLRQRVRELETAVSQHEQTKQALQEAEMALREVQEHLQHSQRAGQIGSWELEPMSNKGIISKGFMRIHGIEQSEFQMDELIHLVPVEDQEIVSKALERVMEPGGVYEVKHRIVHQISGEIRWIQARGEAVRQDGEIIKIAGTSQDITERMHAELELRQSEEHLSVIFNNTADLQLLWVVEPSGDLRVVRINDTYIKTGKTFGLNLSKEMFVGKDLDQVFAVLGLGQDDLDFSRSHYERAITTGKRVKYTDAIDFDSGTYYTEITLVPILDQAGKCQYILFNSHDVTKIKNTADELQKLNAELDKRVRERTEKLNMLVNAMTGREVRMAELKKVIKKLRLQLQEAGMEPVANDPLITG